MHPRGAHRWRKAPRRSGPRPHSVASAVSRSPRSPAHRLSRVNLNPERYRKLKPKIAQKGSRLVSQAQLESRTKPAMPTPRLVQRQQHCHCLPRPTPHAAPERFPDCWRLAGEPWPAWRTRRQRWQRARTGWPISLPRLGCRRPCRERWPWAQPCLSSRPAPMEKPNSAELWLPLALPVTAPSADRQTMPPERPWQWNLPRLQQPDFRR
jgi:hypothetical protein